MQSDSILHFCNFSVQHRPILHYRHIFSVWPVLTVYYHWANKPGRMKIFSRFFWKWFRYAPGFSPISERTVWMLWNHRSFTIKVNRHNKPAFGCKWHYAAGAGFCLPGMSTTIILRVATYRKKGRPISLQFNQQRQKPLPSTAESVLPPTKSGSISVTPTRRQWTTKFCV